MLRHVDATVAISRELEAEVLAFGMPADRVHLIGNGIDIETLKPRREEERRQLRKDLGVEASGLAVFVGRLSPEENPEGLVRAWGMALPKLPQGWKLAFVGDGPMREQLASLVTTMGLSATTILVGFRSDVESWMGAADLFLLPSHYEGLSNAVQEAMASGLVVVGTTTGGSEEILRDGETGLTFAPEDADGLAEQVARLITNPDLCRRLAQAGCQSVLENFTLEEW